MWQPHGLDQHKHDYKDIEESAGRSRIDYGRFRPVARVTPARGRGRVGT
ncbi:hypothetical protein HMPREF0724_13744 [Prescottella equi ATCC 33707]|uniref:Uncharacterized protein n=1 Tax=Prescottella equi ATCC 33707 TaxID=525370 RepID=E9T5B6_RHOHA|nr:hypothetical protein HMPREF0724_13744 [Prescottella equi ATCC 33707]